MIGSGAFDDMSTSTSGMIAALVSAVVRVEIGFVNRVCHILLRFVNPI